MNREKLLKGLIDFFTMLPDSEDKPEGEAKLEVLAVGGKPEAEMEKPEGLEALLGGEEKEDEDELC